MEQREHGVLEYLAVLKKTSTAAGGAKLHKTTKQATGVFRVFAVAARERISEKNPAFPGQY
jgi:hypothetical protein